ncbi:MAG: FAD-dependent oxidoreductase [Planctomycetota bacterium]
MSLTSFDFIVVGQGLAGTALAWSLRWSGSRVLVVDRDVPITSSKVAAGLITPITGQRLVKTWRFDELWPAAVAFYRRVEQETGTSLFSVRPMVRLFSNSTEVGCFEKRIAAGEFHEMVREPEPPLDPSSFVSEQGGFEMPVTGQLDVARYLLVSREHFAREGCYLTADLDVEHDLQLDSVGVRLPQWGVRAGRLIFCQGIDATHNPWFRAVRFKPAKGEILTVRIPGLIENRIVHRGVWLAPLGDELFRVGSTYEWQQLDNVPTMAGRDEILTRLREFLLVPFEVIDHQAAVRPIHLNQYPVVGLHPDHEQLGYFNGLGSKGTLHAPLFASHFVRVLSGEVVLDPEVDLNRKTDLHGCHP